ncbi:hypothetical protein HYFRA_00012421 [Hymenoscyphus fraxineus]|uniref:3beta-hydroxysteroid 3-dehydrogenase n=1 Tax=Hymenoscyphus fraxineus TaxID=746836 RepID=A0A9N9LA64_9HELO|nr:hypothetical protein HYFRA_00012421 [Hymenoscyphus fraxineus]
MAGTVIITGANGSLAIPAVAYLLHHYPDTTLVLTVRNDADSDPNTAKLRKTISQFPNSKTYIIPLDLSHLHSVHEFTQQAASSITAGEYPPLSAIICNAYYWNLVGDVELTDDGFEKTLQVNHIAHVAIILNLVNNFGPAGGKIILFSSDAHYPGKNALEKYPPSLPDNLELLAKPEKSAKTKEGLGFQRYANSKLAITSWCYALNRHLQKSPDLKAITAIALNPGNLTDSRSLRTNTPKKLAVMQRFMLQPLGPIFSLLMPMMRTSAKAAADVVDLAMSPKYAGEQGFFTLNKKDESSPESRDEFKQEKLWGKSAEWAGIQADVLG